MFCMLSLEQVSCGFAIHVSIWRENGTELVGGHYSARTALVERLKPEQREGSSTSLTILRRLPLLPRHECPGLILLCVEGSSTSPLLSGLDGGVQTRSLLSRINMRHATNFISLRKGAMQLWTEQLENHQFSFDSGEFQTGRWPFVSDGAATQTGAYQVNIACREHLVSAKSC